MKTEMYNNQTPSLHENDNVMMELVIASKFVEYIRNKPYRIAKNTKNGLIWEPEDGPVTGWNERLNNYEWGHKNWQETSKVLEEFTVRLDVIESHYEAKGETNSFLDEVKTIYDDVKEWGNPKGRNRKAEDVATCLRSLWNGLPNEVDSTLTKLYAFSRPDHYIIYDSRVATAILSIAEDIYRFRHKNGKRINTIKTFQATYGDLGTYGGSGGTRNRGYRSKWPVAYKKVAAQLDANRLCAAIVKVLNRQEEDRRNDWTMRQVEAVLFMEGY
ncbi:MAG: hypothetical protein WA981_07305 [Glaciecola sp.]